MDKKGLKIYIQKVSILILQYSALLFLIHCEKIINENFPIIKDFYYTFFPVEEFHPCDPMYNYYENNKHFFYKEYLKDDGTIDYKKLLESQKNLDKSACDPLNY